VRLGELVPRLEGADLMGDPSAEVSGITHDSRQVKPGWLFAALPGAAAHGLDYLDQALEQGASAVLTDRQPKRGRKVPWIATDRPRRHTAEAAWLLAGAPQDRLRMVGVTGTNGKSTTADLLSRMLAEAGVVHGLFGTLVYRLPGGARRAVRTTPEATDLAPLLRDLVEAGGSAAVMEVSSHALALDRVAGLRYEVAVWTNLSHDHLDFHGDMESYFSTKRRLFEEHLSETGRRILPADDEWARRLLNEPRVGDVVYGIGEGDVAALDPHLSLDGTTFTLRLPDAELGLKLPLVGRHNLRNALAATAAAWALDLPYAAVVSALRHARPLAGRLEPVPVQLRFPVYVDYAHTPDGLRATLDALREATDRELVLVFGAGGDRDPDKRTPMGRIAGELADVTIVTSDNPRSEDPAAITDAVADGVREAGAEPIVVLDRRDAIARALRCADRSSLVLIAGKGHEEEQVIGDRRLPFSDRRVVLELAGVAP